VKVLQALQDLNSESVASANCARIEEKWRYGDIFVVYWRQVL